MKETLVYALHPNATADWQEQIIYEPRRLLTCEEVSHVIETAKANGWLNIRVTTFSMTANGNDVLSMFKGSVRV
jgi:hypothetical protein